MVINLKGVDLEANETLYIKKESKFLFKIVKVETTGVGVDYPTNESGTDVIECPQVKIHFEAKEIIETKSGTDKYTHAERFLTTPKAIFVLGKLVGSMHQDITTVPDTPDLHDLVGRYFTAETRQNKNDDRYYNIAFWSYKYSAFNDKLPLLQAKEYVEKNASEEVSIETQIPEIDIDLDEIPF